MNKTSFKGFTLATALLVGTIIGAGIFSLPYIFSRLGLISGFFYLIIFSGVYFIIHWMYAETIQSQEGSHRFLYYAHKYLPKYFRHWTSVIILGESALVLTIYLILALVFSQLVFGYSGILALLIFWLIGSVFIFAKLSTISWTEFLGAIGILSIVLIIFSISSGHSLQTSLWQPLNLSILFLPFGPILFSLSGRPAIAKMVEERRKVQAEGQEFSITKVICLTKVILVIIYLIVIVSVLRLTPEVSQDAIIGLGLLSPFLSILIGLMGLFTIWTSYVLVSMNFREILQFDLKYSTWLSAAIVFILPLIFYLIGFQNFFSVVALTGGLFLALEAIFIITIWRKIFPNSPHRWISWPLYLIFSVAIVYAVVTFIT